jgi:hypothetical protein
MSKEDLKNLSLELENANKDSELNWWNKKALEYGRDWNTALSPSFGWFGNLLEADREANDPTMKGPPKKEYRGQNVEEEVHRGPGLEYWNKLYGVESAPDLLAVYTGHITPQEAGLQPTEIRPTEEGGYPWSDNSEIYDITPYMNFIGFSGVDEESRLALEHKIENMDDGDIISNTELLKLGVKPDHHVSVDFHRMNFSIGKEGGEPYLAVADTWDFKTMDSFDRPLGWLMENWGKGKNVKDMGFYGRFKIIPEDYREEFQITPESEDSSDRPNPFKRVSAADIEVFKYLLEEEYE